VTVRSAISAVQTGGVEWFHQASRKHLDRYLDEFEGRFNNRKNPYLFRDTITRVVTSEALPYEKLPA